MRNTSLTALDSCVLVVSFVSVRIMTSGLLCARCSESSWRMVVDPITFHDSTWNICAGRRARFAACAAASAEGDLCERLGRGGGIVCFGGLGVAGGVGSAARCGAAEGSWLARGHCFLPLGCRKCAIESCFPVNKPRFLLLLVAVRCAILCLLGSIGNIWVAEVEQAGRFWRWGEVLLCSLVPGPPSAWLDWLEGHDLDTIERRGCKGFADVLWGGKLGVGSD